MKKFFSCEKKCLPFTLIEVMAVIVIIVILSGIAFGVYENVRTRAKTVNTQAMLASIEAGLEQYKDKFGFYPPTIEDNKIVYKTFYTDWSSDQADEDSELNSANNLNGCLDYESVIHGGVEEKKGSEVRYLVLDAFGNPFYYRCPGKFNKGSFDLGSCGPDGKFGDEQDNADENFGKADDIVNFKR